MNPKLVADVRPEPVALYGSEYDLKVHLKESWDRFLRENGWWKPSEVRTVSSPGARFSFDVYFNQSKQDYFAKKKESESKPEPKDKKIAFSGRFDSSRNIFDYDHFVVFPSITPIIENHFILVPKEIRKEMRAEDLSSLITFSRHSGHKVFINLAGSGASEPTQFHAQAGPFLYPLWDDYSGFMYERIDPVFSRIVEPHYGLRIDLDAVGSGTSHDYNRILDDVIRLQDFTTFNAAIFGEVLYLFPRVREVPYFSESWNFAGQEMGGLFCTRNRKDFLSLDCEQIRMGLKDVTFYGKLGLQRLFESYLHIPCDDPVFPDDEGTASGVNR
ncbi:hypothetical protein JW826_01740 [Candidatus Woesearchaeota archaeon]|nr:hypothetical protein [Candidatus Woesearchaeota archaeon]